jgi:hypothetical protein
MGLRRGLETDRSIFVVGSYWDASPDAYSRPTVGEMLYRLKLGLVAFSPFDSNLWLPAVAAVLYGEDLLRIDHRLAAVMDR